jgi:hypothetical protein
MKFLRSLSPGVQYIRAPGTILSTQIFQTEKSGQLAYCIAYTMQKSF